MLTRQLQPISDPGWLCRIAQVHLSFTSKRPIQVYYYMHDWMRKWRPSQVGSSVLHNSPEGLRPSASRTRSSRQSLKRSDLFNRHNTTEVRTSDGIPASPSFSREAFTRNTPTCRRATLCIRVPNMHIPLDIPIAVLPRVISILLASFDRCNQSSRPSSSLSPSLQRGLCSRR